ncbi:MAG: hypothetical protein HY720_24935 [Planctomycetes bacterium]|nr:hypothetical protein [Planctomycetota bacterium]
MPSHALVPTQGSRGLDARGFAAALEILPRAARALDAALESRTLVAALASGLDWSGERLEVLLAHARRHAADMDQATLDAFASELARGICARRALVARVIQGARL